jgi:hypothetical protein
MKSIKQILEPFILEKDGAKINHLYSHNVEYLIKQLEDNQREFGKELLNEVSKNCSCWIYNEANGESETYPIDLEEILPALDDYLLNNKI